MIIDWLQSNSKILVFLSVALIAFFCFQSYRLFKESKKRKIPGYNSCVPILGQIYNTLQVTFLLTKDGYDFYKNTADKFGKTWGIKVFDVTGTKIEYTVISSDPDVCEHILHGNFANYNKGEIVMNRLAEIFGNGIFNTNGVQWKQQRQVASHLFKIREMKYYVDIFNKKSTQLLDQLESFKRSKQSFDFQQLISKFTLDSIGLLAFGEDIQSLEQNPPFAKAFNSAQISTADRFFSPWFTWFGFLGKNIKYIVPAERRLQSDIKIVNDFAKNMVRERRKQSDEELQSNGDLLSRYLCARDGDGLPMSFSDDYLRDVIMNILLAGRDTTAVTLTCFFHLLSQHPKVEAKLQSEISKKIGKSEPDYDQIKNMPYLTAAINETLRLYPPVPLDPKVSVEDDVLPNGMFVRKNSMVCWCQYAMSRDPEYWDKPLEFRPERWTGQNGGIPINQKAFIPFQSGPRTCLGQSLAYLEMKMVIVRILQRFHLRNAPDSNFKASFSITMFIEGAIMSVEDPIEVN